MATRRRSYTARVDVVEIAGSALLLKARGHINTQSVALFETSTRQSIASNDAHVIIDVSEITYLSSAGLRAFLRLSRELSDSGRELALCGLQPYINQVFELLGFHKVIDIHSDVETALAVARNPQRLEITS